MVYSLALLRYTFHCILTFLYIVFSVIFGPESMRIYTEASTHDDDGDNSEPVMIIDDLFSFNSFTLFLRASIQSQEASRCSSTRRVKSNS